MVAANSNRPRPPVAADISAMLALNAANVTALSPLDDAELQQLIAAALYCRVVGPVGAPLGFLIVLDQTATYSSPNFVWFQDRLSRFAYIDRIVIAEAARGTGHAQQLYSDAFDAARGADHTLICCEVNETPPNSVSDRFHARLGFVAVGRAELPQPFGRPVKSVKYLQATLIYAQRDEL